MDRAQADAIIADLGTRLGMPSLAFDESGLCTLVIDDGAMIVNIGHNATAYALDLMICLDEFEPSGAQLARLLTANFGWRGGNGASFALEPLSGALVVQRRLVAAELGGDGLREAIESLVTVAEGWSKRLRDMQAASEADVLGGSGADDGARGAEWGIRA